MVCCAALGRRGVVAFWGFETGLIYRHMPSAVAVSLSRWTLHPDATSRWDAERCELWSARPGLFFIRAPNGDFRTERSDIEWFYPAKR